MATIQEQNKQIAAGNSVPNFMGGVFDAIKNIAKKPRLDKWRNSTAYNKALGIPMTNEHDRVVRNKNLDAWRSTPSYQAAIERSGINGQPSATSARDRVSMAKEHERALDSWRRSEPYQAALSRAGLASDKEEPAPGVTPESQAFLNRYTNNGDTQIINANSNAKDLLRFYDAAESNPMLMANGLAYNSLGFNSGNAGSSGFDAGISANARARQAGAVSDIENLMPFWAGYDPSTGMAKGSAGEDMPNWMLAQGSPIYRNPETGDLSEDPMYRYVQDAGTGSFAYTVGTGDQSVRRPGMDYESGEFIAPISTDIFGQIIPQGTPEEQAAAKFLTRNNYVTGIGDADDTTMARQLLAQYTPKSFAQALSSGNVRGLGDLLMSDPDISRYYNPLIDPSNNQLTYANRGLDSNINYGDFDNMAAANGLRLSVNVNDMSDDQLMAFAQLAEDLETSNRGMFEFDDNGDVWLSVAPGQASLDYINNAVGDYQSGRRPELGGYNVYSDLASLDPAVLRMYLGLGG